MARRLDERALVVLAVDLHDLLRDGAHRLQADRLIVDEGAGAPVGELQAAQDEIAVDRDVLRRRRTARRMIGREIEDGGHLALRLAGAHQRSVAAAAERERERVEQNRLAGAGLAGEHRQPRPEGEVEVVDEDDVADRELDEHRRDRSVTPASAKVEHWTADLSIRNYFRDLPAPGAAAAAV